MKVTCLIPTWTINFIKKILYMRLMDCQSLSILRKDKTEISHIILGVQAKILGAQSNFQIKDNNIEKIETTT